MRKTKAAVSKASEEKNRLFNEADAAWDKGDLRQAFTLFMQAAKLGDRASQLDLGYFFDNGLFVKQDKKKALEWYRRAYLQDDAGAANNIGTVYRDLGDTRKMLWWFRRAAAMGDPDVLLDLGNRYESGAAVPKSLTKARSFYRRVLASKFATSDGKAEARTKLAGLRKSMPRRGASGRAVSHKR